MLINMANYFDIPISGSKQSNKGQRSIKLIEKLMKALIPANQEHIQQVNTQEEQAEAETQKNNRFPKSFKSDDEDTEYFKKIVKEKDTKLQ